MKWVCAILFVRSLYEFEWFEANKSMKEFTTKEWKNTIFSDFLKDLKEQLQQRLSAVWSGVQQTVADKAIDE